jgi:hypothetical protein
VIINIRGTNGSGKTHLARSLIGPDATPIDLVQYTSPTKKEPNRQRFVEGWGKPGGFLAVGSYKQGCGGMDTILSFELQQDAVLVADGWHNLSGEPVKHVICEGVLASTVAGSWLEFFKRFGPGGVLIAYLDTPLELCLERITARQIAAKGEARDIKVDLVRDKIKAIEATRSKFDRAGIRTITLHHETAYADLMEAINVK